MATMNYLAALALESEVQDVYVLQHKIYELDQQCRQENRRREKAATAGGNRTLAPATDEDVQTSRNRCATLQHVDTVQLAKMQDPSKALSANIAGDLEALTKERHQLRTSSGSCAIHDGRCAAIAFLNSTRECARPGEPTMDGVDRPVGQTVLQPDAHFTLDEMREILDDPDREAWSIGDVWRALRRCHGHKERLLRDAGDREQTVKEAGAVLEKTRKAHASASSNLAKLEAEHEQCKQDLQASNDDLEAARARLRASIAIPDHDQRLWQVEQDAAAKYNERYHAVEETYDKNFNRVHANCQKKLEQEQQNLTSREKALNESKSSLKAELEQTLANSTATIDTLEQKVSAAEARTATGDKEKNEKIKALTEEVSLQSSLASERERSRNDLESKLGNSERSNEELKAEGARIEAAAQDRERQLEAKIEQLEKTGNDLRSQNETLSNDLEEAEKLKTAADRNVTDTKRKLQSAINTQDDALADIERRRKVEEEQRSASEQLRKTITEKDSEISQLSVARDMDNQKLEESAKTNDSLFEKLSSTQQLLRSAQQSLDETQGKHESSTSRNAELAQQNDRVEATLGNVLSRLKIAREPETLLTTRVQGYVSQHESNAAALKEARHELEQVTSALSIPSAVSVEDSTSENVKNVVAIRTSLGDEQDGRRRDQREFIEAFCAPLLQNAEPLSDATLQTMVASVRSMSAARATSDRLVLPFSAHALDWDVAVAHGSAVASLEKVCPSGPAQQLWLTDVHTPDSISILALVELLREQCFNQAQSPISENSLAFVWAATKLLAADLSHRYGSIEGRVPGKGQRMAYALLRSVELVIRLQCRTTRDEVFEVTDILYNVLTNTTNVARRRPLLWALYGWACDGLRGESSTLSLLDILQQLPVNMVVGVPGDGGHWMMSGSKILAVDEAWKTVVQYDTDSLTYSLMHGKVTFDFGQPRRICHSTEHPYVSLTFEDDEGLRDWRLQHLPLRAQTHGLDML